MDPHGAVAYLGLLDGMKKFPGSQGVFLETAHPAKFRAIVEPLIGTKISLPAELQKLPNKQKQTLSL